MSKMTVHTTIDIAANAQDAWRVFGEGFGSWADWAPGIDASTLEGPLAEGVVRVNETPSLGTVRQRLSRYAPGQRALSYEMGDTLPPFFHHMRNDWVIEETGDGRCRLVGEAVFDLKDEAAPMQDKLQGKMGMTLEVFAKAFQERMQA